MPTSGDSAPEREPWNFAAFVQHYNDIAREHSGWVYDASSPGAEKLRQWYESVIWDSLWDFARTRFQFDQQM